MTEHQLDQLIRDAVERNAAGQLNSAWTPPAITEVATLARLIDHTLLKPDAGEEQVRSICAEAAANGFASVCVNPNWVPVCAELLLETSVKVCTVIGFPLGATLPAVKAYEVEQVAQLGAQEVDMVLNERRKALGVTPRDISEEEIVQRFMFALANEGAKILEEDVAIRASDIDVTYLTGRGFPLHRGGPMFYADTVGLKNVVAAIERFQKGYEGKLWEPSKLLLQLAAEGKSFQDYDAAKNK